MMDSIPSPPLIKQSSEPVPIGLPSSSIKLNRAISEIPTSFRKPLKKYSIPLTKYLIKKPDEAFSNHLIEMGFSPDQVELSIKYANIGSIEDAVAFLTTDKDWFHIYKDDNGRCFYCHQPRSSHRLSIQPKKSKTDYCTNLTDLKTLCLMKEEKRDNICCLCFEETTLNQLSCNHYICTECFRKFILLSLSSRNKIPAKCPVIHCDSLIPDIFISDMLTEEQFAKYNKIAKENILCDDPNVRFCPTPNCNEALYGSEEDPHLTCPKCKYELCFNCNESYEKCINCRICN